MEQLVQNIFQPIFTDAVRMGFMSEHATYDNIRAVILTAEEVLIIPHRITIDMEQNYYFVRLPIDLKRHSPLTYGLMRKVRAFLQYCHNLQELIICGEQINTLLLESLFEDYSKQKHILKVHRRLSRVVKTNLGINDIVGILSREYMLGSTEMISELFDAYKTNANILLYFNANWFYTYHLTEPNPQLSTYFKHILYTHSKAQILQSKYLLGDMLLQTKIGMKNTLDNIWIHTKGVYLGELSEELNVGFQAFDLRNAKPYRYRLTEMLIENIKENVQSIYVDSQGYLYINDKLVLKTLSVEILKQLPDTLLKAIFENPYTLDLDIVSQSKQEIFGVQWGYLLDFTYFRDKELTNINVQNFKVLRSMQMDFGVDNYFALCTELYTCVLTLMNAYLPSYANNNILRRAETSLQFYNCMQDLKEKLYTNNLENDMGHSYFTA